MATILSMNVVFPRAYASRDSDGTGAEFFGQAVFQPLGIYAAVPHDRGDSHETPASAVPRVRRSQPRARDDCEAIDAAGGRTDRTSRPREARERIRLTRGGRRIPQAAEAKQPTPECR